MRRALGLAAVLLFPVGAAGQVGDYDPRADLEIVVGPALTSGRGLGAGGTGVVVSQGAKGLTLNPAGLAKRKETNDRFWGFSGVADGRSAPGRRQDFELSGLEGSRTGRFYAGSLGLGVRMGSVGLGIQGGSFDYLPCDPMCLGFGSERGEVRASRTEIGAAVALFDARWLVGASMSTATIELHPGKQQYAGFSMMFGGLWQPVGRPFELGLSFAPQLIAGAEEPVPVVTDPLGIQMPRRVIWPWRVIVGGTYEVFEPFRPSRFLRTEVLSRLRWSWEVVVVGPSNYATGVDAWAKQTNMIVGERITASPRAGLETDVWRRRVRMRVGSYYEPSRYERVPGRLHITSGADVRLFELGLDWTASATVDIASDYGAIGVSLGGW